MILSALNNLKFLFFFISGDLLENYCYNDSLVNVARIVYTITIMLTFPVECFVCREVKLFCILSREFHFLCFKSYILQCIHSIFEIFFLSLWGVFRNDPHTAALSMITRSRDSVAESDQGILTYLWLRGHDVSPG